MKYVFWHKDERRETWWENIINLFIVSPNISWNGKIKIDGVSFNPNFIEAYTGFGYIVSKGVQANKIIFLGAWNVMGKPNIQKS